MAKEKKEPRVALVHDFLREYGGAERVIEALHEIYPNAPVYTAFIDEKKLGSENAKRFANWKIKESFLAWIPGFKRFYSPLRILAPGAMGKLKLDNYDVVISSTNAYFARAARSHKLSALHLDYCHTPTRALYGYVTQSASPKNRFFSWWGDLISHELRLRDFEIAQKVDIFIANSQEVKKRIAQYYRRKAVVINPPVKMVDASAQLIAKFHDQKHLDRKYFDQKNDQPYFLYVNRLNYAKHPELALRVALELGVRLKIVGTGPMLADLEKIVGDFANQKVEKNEQLPISKNPLKKTPHKNQRLIEFCGVVTDEKLAELYYGARGLIYPVVDEDFGMVPIEAMAFGVPVLAHRSGGPTETVIEGKNGLFFDELTEAGLRSAWQKMMTMSFDKAVIRKTAQPYSQANFAQKITQLVAQNWPYEKERNKAKK